MIFVFQLNSLTEKGSSLKHEVFFQSRIKNFEKLTLFGQNPPRLWFLVLLSSMICAGKIRAKFLGEAMPRTTT